MFYETSFLLLAILVTAVITRYLTANEYEKGIFGMNRHGDRVLNGKLYIAKLIIIFLFLMVFALGSILSSVI